MPLKPLTTQIVGSYAKPHWLARHQRMRALDGSWWRPEPDVLQEAREDAALLAIYEQERAGLDLVTDGEAQRAAYDRHFLGALSGIDVSALERVETNKSYDWSQRDEAGWEEYSRFNELKPQIVGEIGWLRSVSLDELKFTKRHARRPVKITVIGPLSLYLQVIDRYYGEPGPAVMAFAAALNEELRTLEAAGADVLQIDEPTFHGHIDLARAIGQAAIRRMVEGLQVPVIVHVCYGYALVYRDKKASPSYPEVLELLSDCPIAGISLEYEQPQHEPSLLKHCGDKHVVLGLLDLGAKEAETPAHVADRLRAAIEIVPADRLHPASDCGMWYLPRELAFAKIAALAAGTRLVRDEFGMHNGSSR